MDKRINNLKKKFTSISSTFIIKVKKLYVDIVKINIHRKP